MYNQNYKTIGKNYHFNQTIKLGTNEFKPSNQNSTGISLSNSLPSSRTNINSKPNNLNGNIFVNSNLNQNLQNKTLGPSFTNSSKLLNKINLNPVSNQQERVINFGQDSSENSFKRNLRKVGGYTPIQSSSYNIITGIQYSNQNNGINNLNYLTRNKAFSINPSLAMSKNILTATGYNLSLNGNPNPNSNSNTNRNSMSYNSPKNSEIYTNKTMNRSNSTNVLVSVDYTPNLTNRGEDGGYSLSKSGNTSGDANSVLNKVTTSSLPLKDQLSNDNKEKSSTGYQAPVVPHSISNARYDENYYYVKDCQSVREYAFKEEPNIGYRLQMEDMSRVVDKFAGDNDKILFNIFDGHGGYDVASYAKNRLPELLEKMLKENPNNSNQMEHILINLFNEIDEEIKYSEDEHVGSTATVVFITREKDGMNHSKKVLYCANVGDSRCVIINSLGVKRISKDHKVSDPAETKRIISTGGVIFAGRIYGQLILSRALGDFSLKKHGVISTPYVSKNIITEKDKYVVLASDGVWDVISDEEMFRLSLTISNSDEFVRKIITNSLMRGTQDNISCFVVKLS